MSEMKFACLRCGQKIACDDSASNTTIRCPACQAEMTVPDARQWKAIEPKDVYIIHGVDSGSGYLAGLVAEGLRKRRFEVYADGEQVASGQSDLACLKEIELAIDVLVIMTPGCLDGCHNEGDRLRQQLRYAFQQKRNVVPIFDRRFVPPKDPLPPDIVEVLRCNGKSPVSEMWEESMNQIAGFLNSKPKALARQSKLERWRARPVAVFGGAVGLLGIFISIACISQLDDLKYRHFTNLAKIGQAALAVLSGLSVLMILSAALAYGRKLAGLKLLRSVASSFLIANTVFVAASIIEAKQYHITGVMYSGPSITILIVMIIPLVLITKLAEKLIRQIESSAKIS